MDSVSSSFQLRGTHLYIMLDDVFFRGNDALVQGLYTLRDQRVETVFVKGAMVNNAGRIPDHVYQPIFEALGFLLEHVERLEVSGDGRFGGLHLPVRAMTAALQNHHNIPQKLRSLRLGNVILSQQRRNQIDDDDNDMKEFADALQRLPILRSIDLVRCRAEQTTASLEPLIHAMCTIPTLQEVMMCETIISSVNHGHNTTGSFLAELCRSSSLIKLWWKTMPGLTDAHIASMADVLRETKGQKCHLKELTIRSHGLGRQAGQAIADMLLTNTTLQVINLDLERPEFGLPLAQALHTNQTLKCLDVWVWNSTGDLQDGDTTNISSLAVTKSFTNMLQHNYVLQFLTFQGLDWTNPEVDFYLRLNRAGRSELLQKFSDRRKWTDSLILRREDVSVVFYFLTLNPFIMCAHNGGSNEESNTATCRQSLDDKVNKVQTQPTMNFEGRNEKRDCDSYSTHVETCKRYKTTTAQEKVSHKY